MSSDDPLSPEDRKIYNFMSANSNMSPREVAEHLGVEFEHICSILSRDLQWVLHRQ